MPVALAALAAAGDDHALLGDSEIGQEGAVLLVEDERADGDADDEVLAALPVHFLAHAGLAAVGLPVVFSGKVEERVDVGVGNHDDAAPVPAVAPVGTPLGNVLLAAERD